MKTLILDLNFPMQHDTSFEGQYIMVVHQQFNCICIQNFFKKFPNVLLNEKSGGKMYLYLV